MELSKFNVVENRTMSVTALHTNIVVDVNDENDDSTVVLEFSFTLERRKPKSSNIEKLPKHI